MVFVEVKIKIKGDVHFLIQLMYNPLQIVIGI